MDKQHFEQDQDPINIKAVRIMGDLHDALEAGGYAGHALERFLVRVLFCLFAEDTGIFERHAFTYYLENRTAADGSDLGVHLARLFEVLNTPADRRQANLDELLADLPYVNGDLFDERLGFAEFNRDMRNALLACTRFDWSRISPAVFGSLFQAVMEPKERRQIGGHYTSERELRQLPESRKRVAAVRRFRAASRSAPTRKLAGTPTRFHVENMPREPYLLIPKVSSERRQYIPLGFMEPEVLSSDLCFLMPGATLVHFGVLSSAMHMAWIRLVCGRLESRYRYSAKLVYNNFPWPELPTGSRRAAVEASAARVLQVRAEYPGATLADLYDPLTMPAKLVKAHVALDRAVDRCYRTQPFATDGQRTEFLFALYAALLTRPRSALSG
jgi:hypothetical protein